MRTILTWKDGGKTEYPNCAAYVETETDEVTVYGVNNDEQGRFPFANVAKVEVEL